MSSQGGELCCACVCGCTRAQGVRGAGWGVPPCCPHPHPDTSDHTSPWEPGGPGGRCRVGGGGVKSAYEQRGGGLCGVCVYIWVCLSMCVCLRQDACIRPESVCVWCAFFYLKSALRSAKWEGLIYYFSGGLAVRKRCYTITEWKGGGGLGQEEEEEEEVGISGIHSSQHNYQLDIGMLKKKEKGKRKRSAREAKAGSAGRRGEEEEGISEGRGWTMRGAKHCGRRAPCTHHWAEGFYPQPSTCTTD